MHGQPHDSGAARGALSEAPCDADSNAVSDDDEAARSPAAGSGRRLCAVRGPLAAPEPPPPVRLVREWKGPTVADLLCDDVAERLPGRVQSAVAAIERGDLAAAERALPGEFPPVLVGPGHARAARRRIAHAVACAALATLALVLAASAAVAWLSS
jgi:hypothetical protein